MFSVSACVPRISPLLQCSSDGSAVALILLFLWYWCRLGVTSVEVCGI